MSYREDVSLSPAQRAVLFDAAPRALVAAGAGSGKTKLLVAYFVHALLDEGIPIEKLAAVTFTRKAGSELSGRIRAELDDRGRPDLARAVDGAVIGTIHGLCRRLLADGALGAGVDPSFGILESDSEKLVKEEVSREAWSRVVEAVAEDELRVLVARGDRLRTLMLSLYERLRGGGHEAPQLHIEPGSSPAAAGEALRKACSEALSAGRSVVKCGASLQKDLETVAACLDWLEQAGDCPAPERSVAAAGLFFPSRRTPSAQPYLAPVRAALAEYRCTLAQEELRPLLAVTNRLLAAFHEAYSAYKEARGLLDFADLELRARALLAKPEAEGGFARVLVDEFQDTNELQCAILEGLMPERLLMVGDERQSIYRFRGADVEVFRRREEASDLSQHRLDTNYRSSPEILEFINGLFSRDEFFGSDRFTPLIPAPDKKPGGPAVATEVLVVDRTAGDGDEAATQDAEQVEAQAVAQRVRRIVDEEGRALSDVVLLLPALRHVGVYQAALAARGLDVYVVRGKGYYSQDEVADVSALLRSLVNPHDALALLTVLRSPLVGVSDDCLYLLGRSRDRRSRSLWQVVRDRCVSGLQPSDELRLQAFRTRLETMRTHVGRPGLSRLIDDAVTACGYDLCLLAAPEGKRRFANIRKLMRLAADFEALEGPDLAGFVSLIGSLGDLGDDEGNAASLAEGAEVIRIMTVHQAKGLEFPVVVLAGLSSDVWGRQSDDIIVGSDGRVAALVRGVKKDDEEACAPHWGPAGEIIADDERREAEEDVRLLYVAMTRACHRLILVGARKSADKPDANRIGRIISALGVAAPPAPGQVVPLPEVHAAVFGVPADPAAAPAAATEQGATQVPSAGSDAVAADPASTRPSSDVAGPPCFLSLPSPAEIPSQISYSALSAYGRCPRRFYLERVLKLAGGGAPGETGGELSEDHAGARRDSADFQEQDGSGRDVGILVHALLDQTGAATERPAVDGLREMGERLAVESGMDRPGQAAARAAELAAAFWDSPFAGVPAVMQAGREVPFSFVHDGLVIQGVMDVLCADQQPWLIVDYKSNALRGRTPAALAEGYEMQAAMYCLAALKAGAPAARMELLFLEQPGDPVGFEFRQDDRAALERRLTVALAGIVEGRFPACAGPVCAGCPVEDVCSAMNRRGLVVE